MNASDFATVVPNDYGQRSADDEDPPPSGSQTPPTPPVEAEPSLSSPPSPCPMRQRAMTQLHPVSIPSHDIVRGIAGSDPLRKIAAFDRHYMPEADVSRCHNASGYKTLKMS